MSGFHDLWSLSSRYSGYLRGDARSVVGYLLALVFVWSGVTKVSRPSLAALAMTDFRVTRTIRPTLGLALGLLELSLAGLVVLGWATPVAFTSMAVLLWLFSALIFRSVRLGARFECACFGQTGSELSVWTLARTVSLALLATSLSASSGPPEGVRWSSSEFLQFAIAMSLLGAVMTVSNWIRIKTVADA